MKKLSCLLGILAFILVFSGSPRALEQTTPSTAAPNDSARAWYMYDRNAPLNDSVIREEAKKGYKKIYFKFTDLQGDEVPGVLTLPEQGAAPYPVVVLMHGFMMQKEDFINAALHAPFAKRGVATIAIDFPLHGDRPGDPKNGFNSLDEAEAMFRQSLFDVLRLFDYVEKRDDLDAGKMGYIGVSMGAIIGSIASGMDERVKVMAFLIGGGGLDCLFNGIDMAGSKSLGDLARNNPDALKQKLAYLDQLSFAGKITPRPVFFFNAEDDAIVKRTCAENLQNAVGGPKEVLWRKSGGHYVDANAKSLKEPLLAWFDKYLLAPASE